jgi:protein-L-isoaspartate O-methyltransferase
VTILPPATALEELIAAVGRRLGRPVPPEWQAALRAVPRHAFLPERVWLRDGAGGWKPCDRAAEPDRWLAAAYADEPAVTQLVTEPDGWQIPTSSASAPGTVVAMLDHLAATPGRRVLEIGTGTGWNAGLLAHRLGADAVCSVEIDQALTLRARKNLASAGLVPAVEWADGAQGWPGGGTFDRLIATCSVRAVPPTWLEQTAPGARLVLPWDTAWCAYGTAILHRDESGGAAGRLAAGGSYMPLRTADRRPTAGVETARGLPRGAGGPDVAITEVSPWAVAGEDYAAQLAVGLACPGVWHAWDTDPGTPGVYVRLWVAAEDDEASWAAVDVHRDGGGCRVAQGGPRRLWDEVTAAWRWWEEQGRPAPGRYGLTVTGDGRATVWLDDPGRPVPPMG